MYVAGATWGTHVRFVVVRSRWPVWLGYLPTRGWLHFWPGHFRSIQSHKWTQFGCTCPPAGHGRLQLVPGLWYYHHFFCSWVTWVPLMKEHLKSNNVTLCWYALICMDEKCMRFSQALYCQGKEPSSRRLFIAIWFLFPNFLLMWNLHVCLTSNELCMWHHLWAHVLFTSFLFLKEPLNMLSIKEVLFYQLSVNWYLVLGGMGCRIRMWWQCLVHPTTVTVVGTWQPLWR
jgi:hypothetical protein